MLGHRELAFDDYMDILRRRRWVVLLPVLLLPVVAWITTKLVTPKYVSTTLVLIEQKRVPDDYVKPVATEDLNARLASLREQIYSRTRLQPIIERFQLYSNQNITVDEKMDLMRKAIDVRPIRSDLVARTQGLPGFTISFISDQPHIAQQVCGEITSLFLSENLRRQQSAVQGTTDFISSQLDNAKRALDDQDAQLAAFQRKYFGEMPTNSQNNLTILGTLTSQLDATTQALSQLQQNRLYLDAMIAQAQQENNTVTPTGQSQSELQVQLDKMIAAEADLESRYTPDYPDVAKAKRDIAAQRKKIEDAQKAPVAGTGTSATARSLKDTPQITQMKAQLHSTNMAIDDKKAEQERIRQRISEYQARVQSSPAVQEQFTELTRGYETALKFYNDLLEKKNHSEMAGDLEKKQQGEQFRVMDPPNLPDKPSFPDSKIFLGGGFLGGLMLGIVLAAALEYRDRSLRNDRDIFAFTKLPTLGTIPITSAMEDSSKRRFFGLFGKRKEEEYAGVQG